MKKLVIAAVVLGCLNVGFGHGKRLHCDETGFISAMFHPYFKDREDTPGTVKCSNYKNEQFDDVVLDPKDIDIRDEHRNSLGWYTPNPGSGKYFCYTRNVLRCGFHVSEVAK